MNIELKTSVEYKIKDLRTVMYILEKTTLSKEAIYEIAKTVDIDKNHKEIVDYIHQNNERGVRLGEIEDKFKE